MMTWAELGWTAILYGAMFGSIGLSWLLARAGLRRDLREDAEARERQCATLPRWDVLAGTGVEQDARSGLTAATLPRSPQAPAVVDPRPTAAGPSIRAAAVEPPHAAAARLQRTRVIFHG